jgi:hypothetical protein
MALKVVMFAVKHVVRFVMEVRRRPIAHADPSLATAHVLLWHRAHITWDDTSTSIILRDVFDNRTYGWMRMREVPDGTEPGGWAYVAATEVASVRDEHYGRMEKAKVMKTYKRELCRLMPAVDKVYFKAGQRNFMATYAPLVDAANAEQRRRTDEAREASAAAQQAALAKRAEFMKKQIVERAKNWRTVFSAASEDLLSPGNFDESEVWIEGVSIESVKGAATGPVNLANEKVTKCTMPTAADLEAATAADLEAGCVALDANATELLGTLLGKAGGIAAKNAAARKRRVTKRRKGDVHGTQPRAAAAASRSRQRDEEAKAARTTMLKAVDERLQAEAGGQSEAALSRVLEGRSMPPMLLPAAFNVDESTLAASAAVGISGGVVGGLVEPPPPGDVMASFQEPPDVNVMEGAGLGVKEMVELAQESVEMVQEMIGKLLDICGIELF